MDDQDSIYEMGMALNMVIRQFDQLKDHETERVAFHLTRDEAKLLMKILKRQK